MVFIKGGKLETYEPNTNRAKEVSVLPFHIDKQLVSFSDFESFVKETNYITDAEKFGNSLVFDYSDKLWKILDGVDYKHPQIPRKKITDSNHPVTQISWKDAKCYCEYYGKRLPTDYEWELSAKNGNGSYKKTYSWGDKSKNGSKYAANFWQGNFPYVNNNLDGFKYTSPVGYFGENELGMTDMGGNVWQWCQDDIAPTMEEALVDTAMRKVLRGGSFLCDPDICHGFNVHGRSSTSPETSSCHIGFRCAKDLD